NQQTLKKQKTAGLCSIGGCVGSIQVLARCGLSSALDREVKPKIKRAGQIHGAQCSTVAQL
ncbi:MAG: hypothetical protein KA294_04070, partial [Giesbergeria sp.]|nr:hypothetical protein [Giesbergeria sp.]